MLAAAPARDGPGSGGLGPHPRQEDETPEPRGREVAMCGCGGRRVKAPSAAPRPPVAFTYVGRRSVHVVGAVTRRSYWFPQPGARQAVDARDVDSLAAVPDVVRVPAG